MAPRRSAQEIIAGTSPGAPANLRPWPERAPGRSWHAQARKETASNVAPLAGSGTTRWSLLSSAQVHAMPRTVFCRKLKRDLPGLPFKPFTDELGQLLYDHVSLEAWQMWLKE